MAKKEFKVGVQQGAGSPEYLWNIHILDVGHREADGLFTQAQYRHLSLQVQELARASQPSHSETVDVKPIENFFEMRERGGVLGDINVRVFFGIDKEARAIVVLGVIKKQNSGQTPTGDRVRMRRRWRKYRNGDYGSIEP